jgi:hypothetical protein
MKSIFTSGQSKYCSINFIHRPLQIARECFKLFMSTIVLTFVSAIVFGQGIGSTVVGFEVDANFHSNSIPSFWTTQTYPSGRIAGDDWSKGPGTTGNAVLIQSGGISVPGITADRRSIWQIDGNWGSNVPPEMTVFAGQSNKNGNPIGSGQSPYTITTGSGGPQKNDITNVMLHTRTVGGNLWLFFGAETRSVNGSSYLDFEYNQAGVDLVGGNMVGLGTNNGRTVNDILLVVNYTNGGKNPVVGVRRWLSTGTWSAELPLTAGASFMTSNIVDVDAVAPNKAYTGDGTPASTSIAFQFVEGALNVSSLGLAGLTGCNPNATVTVKTRSSPSYTSELKDWDILHFPLTPTAAAATTDLSPQCRAANGVNTFNVTGTYANGTPSWSAVGGTLSNENFSNGTATATLTVNAPTNSATVTLTCTTANPDCPPATSSETATINPNPTVVANADPAGPVKVSALPPHYSLSTTVNGTLNNGGFNYSWVQDPPDINSGALSNSLIANPTFTASIAGTFTWTVTATDKVTGCLGTSPVTRIIGSPFDCPLVPRTPICAGTTNTYTASRARSIDDEKTWTWSVNNGASISGSNGGQSVSVIAGTQTFTLTLTIAYFNTALGDKTCTYEITVNPNAVPPSVTYIPPTCTEDKFKVQVNNPTVGSTYRLTQTDGNVVNIGPYASGDLIFTDLHIGKGYSVISTTSAGCVSDPNVCPAPSNFTSGRSTQNSVTDDVRIQMLADAPTVSAAPNPFVDKIRFSVSSELSGSGSLEVYNMMGQKVQTIYQGHFESNSLRTFEYRVPLNQRANLIYLLRIGNKTTSGKLIGIR